MQPNARLHWWRGTLRRSRAVVALFALVGLVGLVAACGSAASGSTAGTSSTAAAGSGGGPVTIVDHWKRTVEVPRAPQRVVVMEWEGLITKSMRIFGVESTLVGVDTATKKMGFRAKLVPSIDKATDIGSAWSGVNYEQLAGLKPDVVFLEAWVASQENRAMHQQVIDKIEALGIPVIVLVSPSNYDRPNISTAWEHITITGQVFGKQAEAKRLVDRLERGLDVVRTRTEDIPEADRTPVAYFATINNVMGTKSIQSYLLTDVVHAKNVAGAGTFVTISEEQLLALDPDAMVLAGHEGYLDPSLVYAGRHAGLNWANLAQLRAVKGKRLTALGYDEWRATVETPIALLKIAQLAYPEKFADIDVATEEVAFYREVYGLDEAGAKVAIEAQKYVRGARGLRDDLRRPRPHDQHDQHGRGADRHHHLDPRCALPRLPPADQGGPDRGFVMLQIDRLSFGYPGRQVLDEVSFTVRSGELRALFGPNGTGKSTLFRCILGLLRHRGTVMLDRVDLRTLPPTAVAKRIAYVPQQHTTPFPFTVFDMVLMGRTPHLGGVFGPRRADLEVCERVLDAVGLTTDSHRPYPTLSGGQRQLVLIARALAQESDLLLLDEPTASLDFGNQGLVWSRIRALATAGSGILVCTHDPNQVLRYCDQVLALGREGRVVADGVPVETVTTELVSALYPEIDRYEPGRATGLTTGDSRTPR